MDDESQLDLWRTLNRIERKVNYIGEFIIAAMALAMGYSFYQSHLEWGASIAIAIGIGAGLGLALVHRRRFFRP
jgi:hypothetical protein